MSVVRSWRLVVVSHVHDPESAVSDLRVIALDVGEKTVGVAVSDPLGIIASPRETLRRDGSELDRLERLVTQEEVGEVVVGLPISLNGTLGPSAARAQEFAAALEKRLSIPVTTFDERLTTAEAEKALIAADTRRAKRRQVIDQVAATLILQGFLRARELRQSPSYDDYGYEAE
jgi:putative Holliday junction resolvase